MTETTEAMIVKFSLEDASIAKLRQDYMGLRCGGAKDRDGYELVHLARMDIKGKRIEVEKRRVELKADALRWGKSVDGEAKRLTGLLAPIEEHLDAQERVFTAEQERLKAEKEKAAAARLQERIDDLQAFGAPVDLAALRTMPEEEFRARLQAASDAFDAAEAKRAADKAAADQQALQQAEERKKLALAQAEAEKAKREAEAAKAAAEKATRDAQEAERTAAAKVQAEKDKAAAVERARVAAEERARAEEAERAKRAEQAERDKAAAREAQKALMPVKERITALANGLSALLASYGTTPPDLSPAALDVWEKAKRIIMDALLELREMESE